MAERPRAPSAWIAIVFLLVSGAVGAALILFAVVELVRDESLGAGAVIADARVTETRIMVSPKRGQSYEVRYAFEVGGRTYSYRDATGRTNLWAPLTHEAWRAARDSGRTQVSYVPDDPWTNRAVNGAGTPIEGHLIGLVAGIVFASPTLLWAWNALRMRRMRGADQRSTV